MLHDFLAMIYAAEKFATATPSIRGTCGLGQRGDDDTSYSVAASWESFQTS